MSRKHRAPYRSLGEAHLYVAVAKADGIVSDIERHQAGSYAQAGQKVFDILGINQTVRKRIRGDVERILAAHEYDGWSAGQHLDEAVALLARAMEAGDWGARLSGDRHEEGLLALARSDGYVFKESRILGEIHRRLKSL